MEVTDEAEEEREECVEGEEGRGEECVEECAEVVVVVVEVARGHLLHSSSRPQLTRSLQVSSCLVSKECVDPHLVC